MSAPRPTPIPIPEGCERALFFGGTFDPPHAAHLDLACAVRDDWMGDDAALVVIPAARSPHKQSNPIASDADRVAMLRLAAKRRVNVFVWTDEIDRGGPSYTIDTLQRAREQRPDTTMRLLIGSDQAREFHRWKQPREIIELADPIVMLRPPDTHGRHLLAAMRKADFWSDEELAKWSTRLETRTSNETSSTHVREILARNPDSPELDELIDPEVRVYITAANLYRVERH
ncbi:MAG: nicotinate (nicotinamide) nucleotide adenylyltransferase [Phycisphaerales bacterium]